MIVITSDSEIDDSVVLHSSDEYDLNSSSTDLSGPIHSSLSDLSEAETDSSGIAEESIDEDTLSACNKIYCLPEVYAIKIKLLLLIDDDSTMEVTENTMISTNTPTPIQSFKLVGDNLDKSVKARYMRLGGSRNQSLHYFHSFAVLYRVDFSGLPGVHPQLCLNNPSKRAISLLPSTADDKALKELFVTHVSRILVTHMPFFKLAFEDVVEWHIQHQYYAEMSVKSEVVSKSKL